MTTPGITSMYPLQLTRACEGFEIVTLVIGRLMTRPARGQRR